MSEHFDVLIISFIRPLICRTSESFLPSVRCPPISSENSRTLWTLACMGGEYFTETLNQMIQWVQRYGVMFFVEYDDHIH